LIKQILINMLMRF